jgi:hypothetical protein
MAALSLRWALSATRYRQSSHGAAVVEVGVVVVVVLPCAGSVVLVVVALRGGTVVMLVT